jgi:hypothetical protein
VAPINVLVALKSRCAHVTLSSSWVRTATRWPENSNPQLLATTSLNSARSLSCKRSNDSAIRGPSRLSEFIRNSFVIQMISRSSWSTEVKARLRGSPGGAGGGEPQQCLNFSPLPHGHGLFLGIFSALSPQGIGMYVNHAGFTSPGVVPT